MYGNGSEGPDDGQTGGPQATHKGALGALDRAGSGAGRHDGHRHGPSDRAGQRPLGPRRLPLPLRGPRDAVFPARRRRLPAAHRGQFRDPSRRHGGDGPRLPALFLRHALPARRAAGGLRRRRPQAVRAALRRPSRRGPRSPLSQVRSARRLRALDLAGRRARDAPVRPVGGVGAPHVRRPARHVRHRLRRARRLAGRVRRVRPLPSASTSVRPAPCSRSCRG